MIDNELQNTDKKHIKRWKKYLHISENSCNTQLADKGLNNDLYNYRGGVFPIGKKSKDFKMHNDYLLRSDEIWTYLLG